MRNFSGKPFYYSAGVIALCTALGWFLTSRAFIKRRDDEQALWV